jgi:hypothetical protein
MRPRETGSSSALRWRDGQHVSGLFLGASKEWGQEQHLPLFWIFERIKTVQEEEIRKILRPKIIIACILKKIYSEYSMAISESGRKRQFASRQRQ